MHEHMVAGAACRIAIRAADDFMFMQVKFWLSHVSTHLTVLINFLTLIMRPSSLGGGRILRRTLSVRLSVCPSVPLSLPWSRLFGPASVTDVLFDTHWEPHIVRPSRPHRFVPMSKFF